MIKASVVGATGYAGVELLRLLLQHPQVEICRLSSVSYEGKPVSAVYPMLAGICEKELCNEEGIAAGCDVLFASLPAGLSEPLARQCVENGTLFIDLGADFRLYDPADYEKWYGKKYEDPALHEVAAYVIPELFGERAKGAKIIGNPGCYPTSVALGLAPALRAGVAESTGIVIDSKSGVTGAGRSPALNTHFPECNEAFSPYKVACHRHTPEIEQTLSALCGEPVQVTFVPHLLPINRGILSTMYTTLRGRHTVEELAALYRDFYRDKPFVRILPPGEAANLKTVKYSNYCDISLHVEERTGRLIVASVIDNMVKGAAGQAIQNMNLCFSLPETCGLQMIPPAM